MDLRTRRGVRAAGVTPLRLRREGDDLLVSTVALARYARQGVPWTLLVVPRFVALRRAAHYACESGVTPTRSGCSTTSRRSGTGWMRPTRRPRGAASAGSRWPQNRATARRAACWRVSG